MWCSVFIPSWGRMKTSRWGNRACLCLFLTSGIPDGLFMQVYVWLCTCAQARVGLNHGWSMQGVLTNLNLGLGDSNSKTKWILSCPWGPPVLVNCRLGHTHEPSQNRGCLGRWVWIFTHLAPPFSHFSDLSYPAGPGGKTKSVFSPSTASVVIWIWWKKEWGGAGVHLSRVILFCWVFWEFGAWLENEIRNFQVKRHMGNENPD